MKAIILAAGLGKRLRPLTLDRPKPMVLLKGKPLLAHIIDILPPEIDELIIVTGYLGEMIKDHFGEEYQAKKINYIEQCEPRGTAYATLLCQPFIKAGEKFLLLFADDLHSANSLKSALEHPLAIVTKETSTPEQFGIVEHDYNHRVIGIEEKPEEPKSNLAAVGVYVLDDRIFNMPMPTEKNGEIYLTEMIAELAREHEVRAVISDFWHPIATPEDLLAAEKILV